MARDRYFVPVTVKIPGQRIRTGQARRRRKHQARLHRRSARCQGRGAGQRPRLPGDQAEGRDASAQLAKRTLAYDTGFTLPPGTYTLKFLARENETGKMGTFETKFVVPDLTTRAEVPADQFSVVLSNQRAGPERRRWPPPRGTRGCSPPNPLVQDNQKLVPSVTRVFKKDQDMFVYLRGLPARRADHAAAGRHRQLLSRQGEGVRDRAARRSPKA